MVNSENYVKKEDFLIVKYKYFNSDRASTVNCRDF